MTVPTDRLDVPVGAERLEPVHRDTADLVGQAGSRVTWPSRASSPSIARPRRSGAPWSPRPAGCRRWVGTGSGRARAGSLENASGSRSLENAAASSIARAIRFASSRKPYCQAVGDDELSCGQTVPRW